MFSVLVGVIVTSFGVCLLANLWKLADRIFDYYSRRIAMGSATVGTFRLVGGGGGFGRALLDFNRLDRSALGLVLQADGRGAFPSLGGGKAPCEPNTEVELGMSCC